MHCLYPSSFFVLHSTNSSWPFTPDSTGITPLKVTKAHPYPHSPYSCYSNRTNDALLETVCRRDSEFSDNWPVGPPSSTILYPFSYFPRSRGSFFRYYRSKFGRQEVHDKSFPRILVTLLPDHFNDRLKKIYYSDQYFQLNSNCILFLLTNVFK